MVFGFPQRMWWTHRRSRYAVKNPLDAMIIVKDVTKRYARAVGRRPYFLSKLKRARLSDSSGPTAPAKQRPCACSRVFCRPVRAGTARSPASTCLKQPLEVKKRIGYLPETPPLYPEMETGEYLRFVGKLKGLRKPELAKARGLCLRALRRRRCQRQADQQTLQRLSSTRRAGPSHHSQS